MNDRIESQPTEVTYSAGVRYPDVTVQLSGRDGNAVAIVGRVQQALRRAGHTEEAERFATEAFGAGSYDALLMLCMQTVVVS